jgi:amidase
VPVSPRVFERQPTFASRRCLQLTKLYLDRIDAYDRRGPSLNAIITVNPRVIQTAAEMDRRYAADRAGVGPLHCIPIILKDNFNTFDMPTTGGNISMKRSIPAADAFTVARMRKAGALILAKGNLQEFARGGMSVSGLGGQVRNPYDLNRTPGGSSGGLAAAVAANFSVRPPASTPASRFARGIREQFGGHSPDARPRRRWREPLPECRDRAPSRY